jgi:predicted nucleotidyltransferase
MLDRDPAYLTELQAILAKHVPDKIVWAYGSRIKGTSHQGSDLDLALIDPSGSRIRAQQIYSLRDGLEKSNLPISVDVLDWAALPESFKKEIERAHVVLQH